eukprot:g22323.t1
MRIQGEDVSPLERAMQYGDPMTIQSIHKAIELFAQAPPLIVLPDVDKRSEEWGGQIDSTRAARNSNVLLQRLRSLTSTWKVPTSTPELVQIEESPKARPRRNSLSIPRPNAKLGLRVPSVDHSLSHVDNPTTRSKSKGSYRPVNATSSVSQAFEGIMAPGMTTEQQRHGTISLANLNKGAHKEILESWGAQDEQGEDARARSSELVSDIVVRYALIPLQAMISVSFLLASNSMRELQVNHFSSIVSRFLYIAASAVCPFLLFRSLSSRDLKLAVGRLNEFLADFTLEWRTGLFIWDSLGEDANGIQTHHIIDVLSVVSFAVCSAWLYVVAYTQSHLLAALDVCLDCWCYDLVGDTDFPSGVITWNRLQALLKSGAALTEKCRNIPALVNQLPSAECIDMERQYLVNFLKESWSEKTKQTRRNARPWTPDQEGQDVRLTSEMLAKLFIIVGGIISGLFAAASRAI